jgi:hypothetical protein
VSIDWERLGQPRFDRVVEVLAYRRFEGSVRAVNGRGGDGGIDIEIVEDDGRLWILQLKYFPEGFSGGFTPRRGQIKSSFDAAVRNRSPDKWSLVYPNTLIPEEDAYVKGLGGAEKPEIGRTIDRTVLDSWLADDPTLDAFLQRDPSTELERLARLYRQERAALLDGAPDLIARIQGLGEVIDSTDDDYTADFQRTAEGVSLSIRPQHPGARPTTLRVTLRPLAEQDQDLRDHLDRTIGYGTSEPVRIPQQAVESLHIEGPQILEGDHPPADVELHPASDAPGVGKPLEIRIFDEDGSFAASFEGTIAHAAPGSLGGSIETTLCDERIRVRFRLPNEEGPVDTSAAAPGVDLNYDIGGARPATVAEVLLTARYLRTAYRVELHIDGDHAATIGELPRATIAEYGLDELIFEQYADDLAIIQRHTRINFKMPQTVTPEERVYARVARLLIEGEIVAAPDVTIFTLVMTGATSLDLRDQLSAPRFAVWRAADPYSVDVAGREFVIGNIYAIHPRATAINAPEAIAALDAGTAEGFHVRYRPGDDPFFYLTLANQPATDIPGKHVRLWGLIGIDQPGIESATQPG